MTKMAGHDVDGCLRYDKYNLVWIRMKGEWVRYINEDGEQQSVSQVHKNGTVVIWPFDIGEDPSDEDPRITARLAKLEEDVKEIKRIVKGIARQGRDNTAEIMNKLELIEKHIGR